MSGRLLWALGFQALMMLNAYFAGSSYREGNYGSMAVSLVGLLFSTAAYLNMLYRR